MTPAPGKSRMHNCVATLIQHGNSRASLDLKRIAEAQGFDLNELVEMFQAAEAEDDL